MLYTGRDKLTRVNDLINWGFNAPVYLSCSTKQELLYNLEQISKVSSRVSIREIKSLGVSNKCWINKIIRRLDINDIVSHLPVMLSQGLPIAKLSGCVLVYDNFDFILELVYDKPVRAITRSQVIPDITLHGNLLSDRWRYYSEYMVVQIIEELKYGPIGNVIYEVSIFNKGCGIKKEQILFWEYEVLYGF